MQQLWIVTGCLAGWGSLGILFSMCPLELAECRIRDRDLVRLAGCCVMEGICVMLQASVGSGSMQDLMTPLVLSLLPGACMLAVSRLTRGSLGMGDAWLFLALGLRLEPVDTYLLAQTACLLAGACGVLGRRRRLPLVPCVAVVLSVQTAAELFEVIRI